ncbi:MAG TPA: bifunctional nuclease family protein [Terrimicrobiaceae bacterium]|jgi:bifunctional DNase/RNase
MSKEVVQVQIKALIPTNAGVAVFLGNDEKVFVIYVDPSVGSAISMFVNGTAKERPLTHDLMALILAAVGARVDRVIVNDLKSGTYFGRLIITAENELQQRKIIELDSRPSDCLAMATQQKAPIFVSREVWDEVEDMSDVLESMQQQSGRNPDEEDEES